MNRPSLYVAIALIAVLSADHLHGGEMDGEWVSIASIRHGFQQLGGPFTASIKDGKLYAVHDGKLHEWGNMSENTDVTPSQFKVEMAGDLKGSGKSINGIFSISGDTMFTCFNSLYNSKRPAAFTSTKDNGNSLIVWMRKEALLKSGANSNSDSPKKSPAAPSDVKTD
jgi:uncharacterized protein (TIGR03067 family)